MPARWLRGGTSLPLHQRGGWRWCRVRSPWASLAPEQATTSRNRREGTSVNVNKSCSQAVLHVLPTRSASDVVTQIQTRSIVTAAGHPHGSRRPFLRSCPMHQTLIAKKTPERDIHNEALSCPKAPVLLSVLTFRVGKKK